jgi:hypothetical protein
MGSNADAFGQHPDLNGFAILRQDLRPPDYECYYLVSIGLYRFIFVFSISEIGIESVHRLTLVFKMSGSKAGVLSRVLKKNIFYLLISI